MTARYEWRAGVCAVIMEKQVLGGGCRIVGGRFSAPPATALLVPALGPKKFAIASAHKREAALYETDGSATQIVCFPSAIRYALSAEQSLCDAAIGRAGEIRSDSAKGSAYSFAPLFGKTMKGRPWCASIHRAPQPRGGVRACFEIAVKRQLGCIVSARGQRLF